jgi:FkbM family methyltransferase
VTIRSTSLKPTIKVFLRTLRLESVASRLHWRLRQAALGFALFCAYRRNFGVFRGTKLYLQFHLVGYPVGSTISANIGSNLPTLGIRAGTVDVTVFEQVFIHRQYDFNVPLSPSLIIDGGAHIGCASVFFAIKFPHAIIYSIEPEEGNFAMLRQNLKEYQNSIPLHAALWSRPASLKIGDAGAESWSFRVVEQDTLSPSIETVLALTIGEISGWTGGKVIDILKLDIEGSEKEIFAVNAERWLPGVRNLVVELHDRFLPGCQDELQKATAPFSYTKSMRGECVLLQRNDPFNGSESNLSTFRQGY